jgi:hypothetical protein
VKVVSPSKGCIEMTGVTGLTYQAKDGIYDMHPADAQAAVKFGASYPSLAGITHRRVGFRCTRCGFGSFFSECSRCHGEAVRETAG